MDFNFRKFIPSVSGLTSRLPGAGGLSSLNHKVVDVFEQSILAFLLACFTGYLLNFLPVWAGGAFVALVTVFGIVDVLKMKKLANYNVAVLGYVGMSIFYFFLAQPAIVLAITAIFGLASGVVAARRFGHGLFKVVGLFVAGSILGTLISAGVYGLLLAMVLPWAHPLTIGLWNISPALVQPFILAAFGYCALRQPKDKSSKFWLIYPTVSTLFLVFYWPSHSYIAQAVGVAAALVITVYGYIGRFTGAAKPAASSRGIVGSVLGVLIPRRQSNCAFALASVIAIVFCADFYVSNTSPWIMDYQKANAVRVTWTTELPASSETAFRFVPFLAATDYCASGNGAQFSQLQESAQPVILPDEKGDPKYYWVCGRYPKRFQFDLGHLIYMTGGMEGAIMVKGGQRGRDSVPMDTDFVFSDLSLWARGAFFARHPASTPLAAVPYRTAHGDYLLVPYQSKVLQWGTMVTETSGVMAISPLGFIQDYMPWQAEIYFPGARINNADMARDYAVLWGHSRSIYQSHVGGDLYEVSEFTNDANQAGYHGYPFWSMYQQIGMKGFIPFEPQGKQQNIIALIGLFDQAKLEMTVVDISSRNLAGPKQFIASLQNAHPGLLNTKLIEAQGFFTPDGRVFWLLALVNPSINSNHGYGTNVVMDCKGEESADVKSGEELLAWVKAWSEKHPNECK